eukprot:3773419-Amphidinium_carterae.1
MSTLGLPVHQCTPTIIKQGANAPRNPTVTHGDPCEARNVSGMVSAPRPHDPRAEPSASGA